jgi:hypothetical protein
MDYTQLTTMLMSTYLMIVMIYGIIITTIITLYYGRPMPERVPVLMALNIRTIDQTDYDQYGSNGDILSDTDAEFLESAM